jgi:hypothetical protein
MEGINLVSVWHKNSIDKISIVPSTINLGNLFNYLSPAIQIYDNWCAHEKH